MLESAQLAVGDLRVDVPVSLGRVGVVPLARRLPGALTRRARCTSPAPSASRLVDNIEENINVGVRFGVLQDSTLIARRLSSARLSMVGAPAVRPIRPAEAAARLGRTQLLGVHVPRTRLAEWRSAQSGAQAAAKVHARAI